MAGVVDQSGMSVLARQSTTQGLEFRHGYIGRSYVKTQKVKKNHGDQKTIGVVVGNLLFLKYLGH